MKRSASSQPGEQLDLNGSNTSTLVRVERGQALGPDEDLEQMKRLQALADMPDSEIDYSDIPALTDEQLKEFVHGPWTPLVERTVTLRIDEEVFEWLTKQGRTQAFLVNLLLKREAQRDREREHVVASSPAGSPPISKAS